MPRIDWERYNFCKKCDLKLDKVFDRCPECHYKVRHKPKYVEKERPGGYARGQMVVRLNGDGKTVTVLNR